MRDREKKLKKRKKKVKVHRKKGIRIAITMLCMVYLVFLFSIFYGIASYQGERYAKELGKNGKMIYAKRYLHVEEKDFFLIYTDKNGTVRLCRAKELTEEERNSSNVIGKVILHW
ncbi:MAG: hypothetical protein HFI37_02675 [Lachnospiraceae bacterium]|jgi:hypothetical protein|nr:hypothetical protein [Lachnospiraceae bacterium]